MMKNPGYRSSKHISRSQFDGTSERALDLHSHPLQRFPVAVTCRGFPAKQLERICLLALEHPVPELASSGLQR